MPRPWLVCCTLLALLCSRANADAGWLQSGDTGLRLDLQLLNDAHVIYLPVSYWPLPRAALQYALSNARDNFATNGAVIAALARVRARAASPDSKRPTFEVGVRGGQAGIWRDFDTLAREDGEVEGDIGYVGNRFSGNLDITMVADPADGNDARADGSQLTMQWGNWLFSAHEMERWWGPGHEGSLILSNNARPMPTLMIERAEARAFETKWLSWLGPWRMSFGVSRMERHRQDVDNPLFMAWRVVIMPTSDIEIGFSRTAQFCGEEQKCSINIFGNLLAGNDNVGIDARKETEPGNQMAGFDLRWNSPIGDLPYAIYAQYIGEDESQYVPAKFLRMLGLEVWNPLADSGLLQFHLEYANTVCTGKSKHGPYYDCAYTQGRFNVEGYRYHARVIGYTTDNDAESLVLGTNWEAANGSSWSLTARGARLNRGGRPAGSYDPRNTVSAGPANYGSLEAGWKGRLFGEQIAVDLGVESKAPEIGPKETQAYGFIGWQRDFGH